MRLGGEWGRSDVMGFAAGCSDLLYVSTSQDDNYAIPMNMYSEKSLNVADCNLTTELEKLLGIKNKQEAYRVYFIELGFTGIGLSSPITKIGHSFKPVERLRVQAIEILKHPEIFDKKQCKIGVTSCKGERWFHSYYHKYRYCFMKSSSPLKQDFIWLRRELHEKGCCSTTLMASKELFAVDLTIIKYNHFPELLKIYNSAKVH